MMDTQTFRETVAANVRDRRDQLGLSQEELARRATVSRLLVSRVEARQTTPTGLSLYRLAEALEVTMDALTTAVSS